MRHQSLNLTKRESRPLQFTLLAPGDEIYSTITSLRDEAKKIFSSVSKVFRLFDEACIPANREDPLVEVKLMGQGLLVKHNRILSATPKSIVGFGFLLPTNRLAYMALATYPKSIFVENRRVEVPYDGNAVWCGLIDTFVQKCNTCASSCDNCVDAHQSSCELLQKAEKLGVLQEVYDSTDYWTTRNTEALVNLSKAFCCGCPA